ncbi:MAG: FKBP-type peptidyl-prolyl cis-trans isomerase [Thermoplasmata archaeon]
MEEGDLVYVEYDVWILPDEEDGEEIIFNTTDEEKAKEHEIYDEDGFYGPRPVIIGSGELMEGFENSLKEAEIGEENTVEVPPDEGVGQRDMEKMELYSMRELQRKDIDPVVGNEVQIDNRRGTIIRVTSGRVRVDFNHPLAGKTLRYDYKITEKPEEMEDKVEFILLKDYRDADFEVNVDGENIEVKLPDECKYDQGWFIAKYRVVGDLRKHLEAKVIRFIEEYEEKEEEEFDELGEETAEEGSDEEKEEEIEEEPEGSEEEESEDEE